MGANWNKKEISRDDRKELRKMFFQKQPMIDIEQKIRVTQRVIYRYISENRWMEKRERYWVYLINYAYRNNVSVREICEICGIRSINILRRIKQKYNIPTQRFNIFNKKIDKEIELNMIRDYSNLMSSKEIAIKYGFKNHKTVLDVLHKFKVEVREPKIITCYNTDYFKKIDSHDKAYIVGLLLTDGYILKDYMGFGIQLQERDGYLLEAVAKRMGESASIIHISNENKRKKAKEKNYINFMNSQDMKRLTVHNREIALDLKKINIVRNKTFILRCPKIKNKFLSSFFRGLWDGDGTIGIAKNRNIWCKIVGASRLFFEDLENIDIPFNFILEQSSPNLYTYRLVGGNDAAIKFLKWIYKDKNDLYLKRKYEKVQNKIC